MRTPDFRLKPEPLHRPPARPRPPRHVNAERADDQQRGVADQLGQHVEPGTGKVSFEIRHLLRDPVERAWSHWRMEYARGWETQPFAFAIREASSSHSRAFDSSPSARARK